MNHQAIQHCLCFPHSHLSFFSSFYWQHGLLKTDSDAEWLAHFFMTSRKYSFRNGNTPPSKIHTEGEKLGTKIIEKKKKNHRQDFPGGGPGIKNPPANARDMGSIPGPGRFHIPWSNSSCVPQLLSLPALEPMSGSYWARVQQLLKPVCLEPVLHNKRSCHSEPGHCN